MKKNHLPPNGFIALSVVLMTGALIFSLGLATTLRSREQVVVSTLHRTAYETFSLADVCAEIAINKLQNVLNYAGNEVIAIESNTCSILPIEGTGPTNRIIKTQSTIRNITRKIKITITQVSYPTIIGAWQEVADF